MNKLICCMLAGLACLASAFELVPFPKEIMKDAGKVPVKGSSIAVTVPGTATKGVLYAKGYLERKFAAHGDNEDGAEVKVVLGLAGDPLFDDTPLDSTAMNRPQEYGLRCERGEDGKVTVYAAGGDVHGVIYAAVTICQMLDSEGLQLLDIQDWPDFETRWIGGYGPMRKEGMEPMIAMKVNGFGIQHRYDWRKFGPDEHPMYYVWDKNYKDAFQYIKEFREETEGVLNFMMMFNLYCEGPLFDATDEASILQLIENCRYAAQYVQEIMIQFDDYTPVKDDIFTFVSEAEAARFRSIGEAQGYIVTRVHDALKECAPDVKLSVCPGPYALKERGMHLNKEENRQGLRDLADSIPADVAIIWTGPFVDSMEVSRQDYDDYSAIVNGHQLMLWDNSMDWPHTPMEFCSVKYFPEMAQRDRQIYINSHSISFFWTLMAAYNFNDYLWNAADYDMERSFAAVFFNNTGRKIPDYVIQMRNDLYAFGKTDNIEEKKRLARQILDRKPLFQQDKLDWSRIDGVASVLEEK